MNATLNELDPPDWGPAPPDSTGLVMRCHALREKPLADFSVENLRLMIGQQIALPHLLPLALGQLDENPLAEGDLYRGDLLNAVLGVDEEFWSKNLDLLEDVRNVLDALEGALRQLAEPIERFRVYYGRAYGMVSSE